MKQAIILGLSLLVLIMVSACSPAGVGLTSEEPIVAPEIPQFEDVPAQKFEWITEDGGHSQLDFNPQVDILFVTDNSDSMKSAQANLLKNLDRFTSGITSNKMIDYHIGVISTWDSSDRFVQTKKDTYGIGELRFVKDSKGVTSTTKRFVTKSDNNILASTLNIGVAPHAQGGPEFEEFFSPLASAFEKTGRGAANEEFFRKDAQLVVIVLTDADDSSKSISPEQMAQTLIDFKGGRRDKVSVYGVLVRANTPDQYKDWDLRIHPKYHPECFDMTVKPPKNNGTCTGFGPKNLEKFIYAANANAGTMEQALAKYTMSIRSSDFGKDLGKIGDDITVKTLEKEILLQHRPRADKNGVLALRVRYGNQVIPNNKDNGWLYNPENNSVSLSGNIKYKYVEGARFAVDLIPVNVQ